MAVVTGEDHCLFAARMDAKDRAHFFGQENRAAPSVRDAHRSQRRMQMADAVLQPTETLRGFASAHIVSAQIVRAAFNGLIPEGEQRWLACVWRD